MILTRIANAGDEGIKEITLDAGDTLKLWSEIVENRLIYDGCWEGKGQIVLLGVRVNVTRE